MFTLQDGREHLYQWDLDRYIIVNDKTICEVHFCNRTSDCSLVVEVKDGLAAIPNILLQEARPIRVYAYCDDKYTLTESQFTVKSRTRPEDYVYTETDVKRFDALDKRLTELENNIDATVAEGVTNYLTEHPVEVDLSDYYTKAQTNAAIEEAIDGIEIPETDLTGYATQQFVLDKVAEIDIPDVSEFIKEIPEEYVTDTELNAKGYLTEHQDLSSYATKTYVNTSIAEANHDSYFLDFSDAVLNTYKTASATMVKFAKHIQAANTDRDLDACAYIKDTHDDIYYPAILSYGWNNGSFIIYLTKSCVNLNNISVGQDNVWDTIQLRTSTAGDGWVYQLMGSSSFTFASKQYVDDAIANIDTPSGKEVITFVRGHTLSENQITMLLNLWEKCWNEEDVLSQYDIVIQGTYTWGTTYYTTYNVTGLYAYKDGLSKWITLLGVGAESSPPNSNPISGAFEINIQLLNSDGTYNQYSTITPKFVASENYYTKDEVNALFDGIATAEGGSY